MDPADRTRRSLLVAGAGLALGPAAWARAQSGDRVVLGQVSLSFYAVTGAVVHALLLRLGHAVEVRQGPHEEIFPLLGSGEIDLMAAVWLPEGHAAYWKQYGAHAREVATLYDGARFFWGVPDYVPRSSVASIDDLAKPAVAGRMTQVIQGIGSGATITSVSRKAVSAYGLDTVGYSFRPGTAAEWIAAYRAAVAEQRWMIFPTWFPQYLNRGGRIRPLDDPKGTLGIANHGSLVAPVGRWDRLPARTRQVLGRVSLGIDGVTEMDWLVNEQGMSPADAARTWMAANAARVDGWMGA